MTVNDPYEVLGVARDASKDEIKSSYRKLAREHHPDVNPDEVGAEERFKDISAAYGVLSDDDKRARYDEFGAAGLKEGFDPEQARAYQHWSRGAGQSPFQPASGKARGGIVRATSSATSYSTTLPRPKNRAVCGASAKAPAGRNSAVSCAASS